MTSRQSRNNDKCAVLIVGAGPVGLLLANFLGRLKVDCILLDKRREKPEWSQAIGVTPPSLEILREIALDQPLVDRGIQVAKAHVHDDYGCAGHLSFNNLREPFPFILTVPQATTMKVLTHALSRYPTVDFRPGCEMMTLTEDDRKVDVAVQDHHHGKVTSIQADWLIGCDGNRSRVRETGGFSFTRAAYRQAFVMADYADNTHWGAAAHLFFTRHGSVESFPLPDNHRRWVVLQPNNARESADTAFLAAQVKRLTGHELSGRPVSPCFQFQPEKVRVRKLVKNRVLLAGDAAHVISPIGGQGMNSGFADVEFLACIMRRVLEEGPACSLLRAYDHYRQRAVRAARRRAAAGMRLGTWTGVMPALVRTVLLRTVLLRPPVKNWLPTHFAMLNLPYNRFARIPVQVRQNATAEG